MAYEYDIPEFLTGQSTDEIHERMLATLPSDIDKSENSIPWDFTRPSALEKASFVEYNLNETVKLIFPQWAYGHWLDYHGELRNIYRKSANKAFGILRVTGVVGTVIPQGFRFATPSSLTSSVLFETVEEVCLEGGNEEDNSNVVTVSVEIEAVFGGLSGNVVQDTIKLMSTPLSGISYVTNPEDMTGGTAEEEDESFRERILDAILLGSSFTGCNSDYIRWAKEISGVGYVVVEPEWNDPTLPEVFRYTDSAGATRCAGAVRLIIADENGEPANEQIISEVTLHILGEDERDIARLAPIGAKVTVVAPESFYVSVSAVLILEDGESLTTVLPRITANLSEYWVEVASLAQVSEGYCCELRYVKVGAAIANADGVLDYSHLLVNGGMENLWVTQAQYPVTGEVSFVV